jgi:penicillin-binding protein 1C
MIGRVLKRSLLVLVISFVAYLLIPFSRPFKDADYSLIVKDEQGKIIRVFLNKDEQWCLPPEDTIKIPDKLKQAVICFEDNYFQWHPGVNPVSVVRAIYQNIAQKRIVSGASTITMQVARLEKRRKRTLGNKIIEMFKAVKIDIYYSKNKILKLYLNHAPYGSNIIGYRAASWRYFEKLPQELSWAEAALLAVLPNAPGLVSPSANRNLLKKKRDQLLDKLYRKKIFDSETHKFALLEPVPVREYPFEALAPHLSQIIYNNSGKDKVITTTISYSYQSYLESLLKHQLVNLQRLGIRNGAALVIETQTGKVKAYVGSQDFFDSDGQGQVNGVTAPRSSGSLLKPFLYALSIDEGLIVPQTLLKDVPSYFDAFSPNNADEKFNGVVTAKEALIRSLNVPAVRLLNTYGVSRFYSFLKKAGMSTLFRQPDDYGLPLIIGGAETTLWDMAMFFRGLGNYGKFQPSWYLLKDSVKSREETVKLISSGAAYLTLDILKELKRPETEFYWQQYQGQKPIAWKTGTSYGHKDAWAIGVSPQWTVAVWLGNFDSEPNLNLSGTGSAGPLLFEIFNFLPHDPRLKWFEKIEMDFKKAIICRETGFLAGDYCDHKDTVDVPVFMLPLRLCPFHTNLFLDKEEKYSVCSYCWKEGYHEKHYLVFPADINYQLKLRGQWVESVPDHNPACKQKSSLNPLQFIYPLDSAQLWVPRDFDGKLQKIVAKIAHDKPIKNVFWYLDDEYLGNTKNKHIKAIDVEKGWHNIMVMDEDGYKDKVKFHVMYSKKN